jgi:hypothetical protein
VSASSMQGILSAFVATEPEAFHLKSYCGLGFLS